MARKASPALAPKADGAFPGQFIAEITREI
jgi:hypothetical protein